MRPAAADNRNPWFVALLRVVRCLLQRFLFRIVRCLLQCCPVSVASCKLHAVRCNVACSMLRAVGCRLHAVWSLLSVVRRWSIIVFPLQRCLFRVVCCQVSVACSRWHVARRTSGFVANLSVATVAAVPIRHGAGPRLHFVALRPIERGEVRYE